MVRIIKETKADKHTKFFQVEISDIKKGFSFDERMDYYTKLEEKDIMSHETKTKNN